MVWPATHRSYFENGGLIRSIEGKVGTSKVRIEDHIVDTVRMFAWVPKFDGIDVPADGALVSKLFVDEVDATAEMYLNSPLLNGNFYAPVNEIYRVLDSTKDGSFEKPKMS